MTKQQEYALRSFIKTLRPEGMKNCQWDLIETLVSQIVFYSDKDYMKQCVTEAHQMLEEECGKDGHDQLLSEVNRFERQLYQDRPGADVATTEQVRDEHIVDADGVDMLYGSTRTVYHLFAPWRAFKAGDVIWLNGQWDITGHFEESGWWYYQPQKEDDEEDEEEVNIDPVETQTPAPAKKAVNNDDEEDGYW